MPTVLLVEDAFELASVISRELQVFGHDALQAPDGMTALRYFSRQAPDFIYLDWMLSGLGGLGVLRLIPRSAPPRFYLSSCGAPTPGGLPGPTLRQSCDEPAIRP